MSKFGGLSVSLSGPTSSADRTSGQLYFSPKHDALRAKKKKKVFAAKRPSKVQQIAGKNKLQTLKRRGNSTTTITFQQPRQKASTVTKLPSISNVGSKNRKKQIGKRVAGLTSPTAASQKFKFGLGIAGTTAVAKESNPMTGPGAFAQLKRVCAHNDKRALESLIANGIDIDLANKVGSTVLMDMAWDGNLPMCSLLLRYKANVNKGNFRGNTPLHFAYERGHKNLIRLLELAGADRNAKNNVGNTPEAVARMKRVHKHGASELAEAITKCDVAAVKQLLREGVNPSSRDIGGHSVLMRAVLAPQNAVDMIRAICAAKADLDMQDATSLNSALHVAYEMNNNAIVDALVSAGAKTFLKNRSGYTPQEWGQHLRFQRMGDLPTKLLQMCEDGDRLQLEEFLKNEGTEAIHGYDQTGRTPLIIAVTKSNDQMVQALIGVKADVNEKELKGARNGPLHAAYDIGNQDIVKVLLDAKADAALRNRKGFTPEEVKIYAAAIKIQAAAKGRLQRESQKNFVSQRGAVRRSAENIYSDELEIAVINGSVQDVVRLTNARASLDARNSGGRTVLMMAVQHDKPAMVTLLISELKANPNVQDIRGNTALHIAYELNKEECITALEENGADVYVRNNIGFTGRGLRLQRKKPEAKTPAPRVDESDANANSPEHADSRAPWGGSGLGTASAPPKGKHGRSKPAPRKTEIIDSSFARCISDGDITLVKEYIQQRPDLDLNCIYPRSGDTPLITAAKEGNTALCMVLIELDADPNVQNNRGNSVLHIAHTRENQDLIQFLEDLDIMKCSLRNDNGYTAQKLSQRIQRARKAKEDELRARQVFSFPQDLHDIIESGQVGDLSKVMDWIAAYEKKTAGNIKAGTLDRALNAQNAAGDTVLSLAVEKHDLRLVQLLVQSGADMNIQNRRGNSAMHVAYEQAQPPIIMYLLAQGGDLSLKNNVGYNPEQLLERVTKQKARQERQAAAAGKQEAESSRIKRHKELSLLCHKRTPSILDVNAWIENLKKQLKADGLDDIDVDDAISAIVNTPNKMSETILFHLARECGEDGGQQDSACLGIVKLLLPYADVGVENLRGDTVLHAAYEVEDEELRSILLKAGADPTATNNNGFTPADTGRRVAKRREMQLLMQQDAVEHKTNVYSKELEKAVRSNDLDAARQLLVRGANVNAQNANGSTVLMDAVWNGNLPMVELLCDSNADPNIANLRRNTALHFAYEKEHTDIAIYIEAHNEVKLSVNGLGKAVGGGTKAAGLTEQAVAMQRSMEAHNHARTGKKFSTMLLNLIENDDTSGVSSFLATVKKEAEDKFPNSEVDRDDYMSDILDARSSKSQSTVLMAAVQAKNADVVKQLLEHGADPNLQNSRGDTVLHFAMRVKDSDIIELLNKYQADSEIRNRMGMTPNDVKARIQRKQKKKRSEESQFDDEMAEMINRGDIGALRSKLTKLQSQCVEEWDIPPTINAQNNVGLNLLMVATYDSKYEAMQLLIDAKTDLNVKDRRGETALHIASEMLASEAVSLLNNAGADKTLTNRVGLTPPEVGRKAARQAAKLKAELEARQKNSNSGEFSAELSAACSDGELESVVDLLEAKADVNAQNKKGSTVLMDAAWNGHAQIVMELVQRKADPEIANLRQNTALHFAYMCEHVDVIEYLESIELASLTAAANGNADGGSPTRSDKKKRHRRGKSVGGSKSKAKKYVSPVVKIQAQFRGKKARKADAKKQSKGATRSKTRKPPPENADSNEKEALANVVSSLGSSGSEASKSPTNSGVASSPKTE